MASDAQTLLVHNELVDGLTVIKVSGEIDLATVSKLRSALAALDGTTTPVVIDLTEVGFMDSTGLSAIIMGYRRAKELQRPYCLAGLRPGVAKVFKVTGVNQLIPIYATLTEARSAHPATSREG